MSFEEMIGGLLEEKIAPLVAKVAALEAQNKELVYLLTSNGGERAADLLTKEQVAARLKVQRALWTDTSKAVGFARRQV